MQWGRTASSSILRTLPARTRSATSSSSWITPSRPRPRRDQRRRARMATDAGASPTGLPLPKGGGATRGLGDGFTPDFNRGTGSYSIDIEVPRGYRDLTPTLALAYNTAAGNGPFGLGWAIALPRVQMDTDRG